MFLLLLHQKARRKPDVKVNNFRAHGMSSSEEQGDLYWTFAHQVTQNGMLTKTWSSLKVGI